VVSSCLKAICVDALLRPDLESSQSHLDKVKPTLQVIIRKIDSLQLVPASRQILAGGTPAGKFSLVPILAQLYSLPSVVSTDY